MAGTLAWPGRHCGAVGRTLPVSFEEGTEGEGANYWINDEIADLFNQVR